MRLGMSWGAALLLLLASLVGRYFNVPVAQLPGEQVMSGEVIDYFGMRYVVPVVEHWPGTLVAVNVGSAVIPTLMSLYLLVRHALWARGLLATVGVAVVIHALATPVRGIGMRCRYLLPRSSPPFWRWCWRASARPRSPMWRVLSATLIGAELTNLDQVFGLGAPVASIGGAGTFDGVGVADFEFTRIDAT